MPSKSSQKPQITRPTAKERQCWALVRAGVNEDEVAARMSISVDLVKQGVAAMENWRLNQGHEVVDASMNEMVMGRIDAIGRALDEALVAESVRVDMEGNIIQSPDHHTRMEAMEKISTILRDIRPKGGDKGVAVNILNQTNNANGSGGGGRSFEARVRQIRESKGMRLLDAGTVNEPDGDEDEKEEILEGDVKASDDVEADVDDEVEPDYPEVR